MITPWVILPGMSLSTGDARKFIWKITPKHLVTIIHNSLRMSLYTVHITTFDTVE